MKYFSEKLHKLFDTEDALVQAEAEAIDVEEKIKSLQTAIENKEKELAQLKKEYRKLNTKEVVISDDDAELMKDFWKLLWK